MIAGLLINGFEKGALEENGGWTGLLFHAWVAVIMRQFFRKLAFAVMVKGNASAGIPTGSSAADRIARASRKPNAVNSRDA